LGNIVSIRLFGIPVSPYVSRVLLVAELKGIELPLVGPQLDEGFARLNRRIARLMEDPRTVLEPVQFMSGTRYMAEVSPQGKMPALEVDGRFLGESVAIAEFLNDRFPDPPLMPHDAFERAKVRQLCLMCDLSLSAQLWPVALQVDPLTRCDQRVREIKAEVGRSLYELDQVMGSRPWACGDRVSLADCVMISTVLMMECLLTTTPENLGLTAFAPESPFSDHPKVRSWWMHVQQDRVLGSAIQRYRECYAEFFGHLRTPDAFGIWWRARAPRI
jgi:glutathione S-transferase